MSESKISIHKYFSFWLMSEPCTLLDERERTSPEAVAGDWRYSPSVEACTLLDERECTSPEAVAGVAEMKYAFKLHSCPCHELLPLEHGQVAIGGFNFSSFKFQRLHFLCHFLLWYHLGSASAIPLTLFRDTLITPSLIVDPAPESTLVHSSLAQVPWSESRPVTFGY
ncbi:hypothetical protein SUGI_0599860 [Cryptomeria japonica]|nr:hypothetical protein SUGI_0599860 [Cryptomeria japonica]